VVRSGQGVFHGLRIAAGENVAFLFADLVVGQHRMRGFNRLVSRRAADDTKSQTYFDALLPKRSNYRLQFFWRVYETQPTRSTTASQRLGLRRVPGDIDFRKGPML